MDRKFYIYSLSHPVTKEIRYIGKTSRTLKKRLSEHVSPSKLNSEKGHKSSWVKSLLRIGLKPEIVLIKETTSDNFVEDEIETIRVYRENGFRLVNETDGGEGHFGYKKSKESVEKTVAGLKKFYENNPGQNKGKVFSEEHKKNISLGKIGKRPNVSEESKRSRSKATKSWWANPENAKAHGLSRRKLTPEQENTIKELYLKRELSIRQIRERFNISATVVMNAAYGRNSKIEKRVTERKGNNSKLNYHQVFEILQKAKEGLGPRDISKIYKVNESTIANILHNRSHVNTESWKKFLFDNNLTV